MSGVLRTIGQVAGVVASVAAFIPGGQGVAAIAAAVSTTATIGAQLTAAKPAARGSATDITIGPDLPSPYILGESYYGGSRVLQVGYGTDNDVPNAYAAIVDVYGVAGPYTALVQDYADFTPVNYSGGNATGFYHDHLYQSHQLGSTPEASALAFHYSGAPGWGGSYKLSNMAAIARNARFPKSGKKFGAGLPQFGAVWRTPAAYDPREDNEYPGGSGTHSYAPPSDISGHSAAKATWAYTRCPGLQALRYALGSWVRNETSPSAPYVLRFGLGLPMDGIVVADFVELANVCDANGWHCDGVILEPGEGSKWSNLLRILAAGGAEPCSKGGRLGLRIRAPKIAVDTIGLDDIAGKATIGGVQDWRTRRNTLVPKFRSPAHRWEIVPAAEISDPDMVEEDGEERRGERVFECVTSAQQAAELAGYDLVDGREWGPIEVPVMPRLRRFFAGEVLALSAAVKEAWGVPHTNWEIRRRRLDPTTMLPVLVLTSLTAGRDVKALSMDGIPPPDITIESPEDRDDVASADPVQASADIRNAYIKVTGDLVTATDAGSDASISIAAHAWDYPGTDQDVARDAGAITGLAYSTTYYVYFDDPTLAEAAPTYEVTTAQADGLNSSDHPYRHYLGTVTTPAPGGGPSTGGGGGGGYCVVPETPILMADGTERPAGSIIVGEWVWTQHETTRAWGNFEVTVARRVPCPALYSATIDDKALRGSGDHPVWIDDGWRTLAEIGTPAGSGDVILLTVADAHTYVANGVLSHNKQVDA